jgi:DNA-binding beta-propeller fold protein YncE
VAEGLTGQGESYVSVHAKASFAKGICARSLGVLGALALAILALFAAPAFAAEVHVLSSSFGAPGSGDGQLSLAEHSGLAVNQTSHDVYVADTGNGRVEEFTAAGAFVRTFGSFQQATFVAVDNSGGLSQGDVYVVDSAANTVSKFTAAGVAVGAWGIAGALSGFGALAGIAVDTSGNLFVLEENSTVHKYGQAGSALSSFEAPRGTFPAGLAVDSEGNLYKADGSPEITKFTGSGENLGEPDLRGDAAALAIDPFNDDLYVVQSGEGGFVDRFAVNCGQGCTPLEEFGPGDLSNPQGVAVDATSHHAYVANAGTSEVGVFSPEDVEPPTVSIDAPVVSGGSVHASGTINSEGHETTCRFEYVTALQFEGEGFAGAQVVPCAANPGSGTVDVSVEADFEGLEPNTAYHLRLAAKNAGGTVFSAEPNPTFATGLIAPTVDSTSLFGITTEAAEASAQIRPGGAPTTYHFEYVTAAHFEAEGFAGSGTTPELGLSGDSDNEPHEATGTITGLAPRTAYYVRAVAHNEVADVPGPAQFFTTYPSGPISLGCPNQLLREENNSLGLSDCRAYEQVSPPENAPVYIHSLPRAAKESGGISATSLLMQSSADGNSVAYIGDPPVSGEGEGTGNIGGGEGDQHLAVRGEHGWAGTDISPRGARPGTFYEGFSGDLTKGTVVSGFREQAYLAPDVETACSVIYSRSNVDGAYQALFNTADFATCDRPLFVGASADYSHILFESADAKVEGAAEAGGEEGHLNLYDAFGGQLHLVNVLPGPAPTADPDASVGSLANEGYILGAGGTKPAIDTENAIARDGSRVFWTDLATGIVYERVNPGQDQSNFSGGECVETAKACTEQVSLGDATYWSATPDGHYAYYTENGELWRFDTTNATRESLTGAGAGVLGVLGVNQKGPEGSYLYFVGTGKLSEDAETRSCQAASGGTPQEETERGEEERGLVPAGRGCNLYLMHDGEIKLVAVLLPSDNEFTGSFVQEYGEMGDWRQSLNYRSAELSGDGTHLVFMSDRRLTPYDNVNVHGGCGPDSQSCDEVYVYDATADEISCASCSPTGLPPTSGQGGADTFLPASYFSITRQQRAISADGTRAFFTTDRSLSPSDLNEMPDVYEWEAPGTGSCGEGAVANGGGCVYLLSDGAPDGFATLVDTSESGDDAFFVTRARLAPSDTDEKPDLYDVRTGGGFPAPVDPVPCEADACRGPIAPQPGAQSPGSSTFSGPGNQTEPGHKHRKRRHSKKRRHHHKNHKPHSHGGGSK